MKLKHFLLIVLGLTFGISRVTAQKTTNFCDHDAMQAKNWEKNPQAKADFYELLKRAKSFEYQNGKKRVKFIIPVVFHVIHNDGNEHLDDSLIIKQLEVLNKDFQKLNVDTTDVDPAFKDLIANCGFEFRLATKDPKGNCTNGITHTKSHLTTDADNFSKLHQWNRNSYLNIWVVKSFTDPQKRGYSQLPDNVSSILFYADGVILVADEIALASRVLTHEVGHYLGLSHTFGGANTTHGPCGDDDIDDTPRTKGSAYNYCFTKPSNNFISTLCDVSSIDILNTFNGVTTTTGSNDTKSTIGNINKFQINYEVNNYLIDTVSYTYTFPKGAKALFKFKNLSTTSTLKNKAAYANWPLGGTNKDTVTTKYKDSLNTNKYYQLEYVSSKGNSVDVKGLYLVASRNSEGIKSLAVRSSLDNFQSNLEFTSSSKFVRNINNTANYKADTTSPVSISFNINDSKLNDLRDNNKITFRVYAWNAESKSGSFNIDSLFILGDTTKMNIEGFKAVGLSSNSTVNNKLAFNNWGTGGVDNDTILANQTGAINLNKYYEFKTSIYKRKLVNLDSISFVVNRNLTGVKNFSVRSSVDNFSSDLNLNTNYTGIEIKNNQGFIKYDSTTSFNVLISLSNNSFKDLREDKVITFRLYAWNAENTNGTFEVDSLRMFGKASSIENVDNFMDYTDCIKMFTKDQAALMTAILSETRSIRYDLHQEANLKNTGTDELTVPTCTPKPYFTSSNTKICSGGLVTFKDLSWNSGVTSRSWTFQDGNPATSTDQNPKVFFSTPGYKKVSLKVKNSAGEDSLVITNAIYVTADQAQINGLISENFNTGISSDWLIENQDNNFAQFSSNTGRWGSKGIKLNNYKDVTNATPLEEDDYFYYQRLRESKDAIISPSINFKTLSDSKLHFDYAYATSSYYDSLITEKIEISYSSNCGKTWTPLHSIVYIDSLADAASKSSELITAGIYGGKEFIPTTEQMWKTAVIDLKNIEKDPEEENIRIKIEFVASSYSNNLYIDNINFFGSVSIEENPLSLMNFEIVPNPTSNDKGINIQYLANNKAVTFELLDLQGKVISKETNNNFNGTITHSLKSTNQLNSGYYTLRISQGEFVTNKKVIIQ